MDPVPPLDPDHCYVAVQSRDQRFDGWFVTAVRTTGIYCRPSCPAITPKRDQRRLLRRPQRPRSSTGSGPASDVDRTPRPDRPSGTRDRTSSRRAMRLIADGFVEREGVAGLARRLGYSERHLNRVLTDELGAGPLAIARAQRAHTARLLVETTDDAAHRRRIRRRLRQRPTVQRHHPRACSPRRRRRYEPPVTPTFGAAVALTATMTPDFWEGWVTGRVGLGRRSPCGCRCAQPFAAEAVMAFIGERAIGSTESWDGVTYRRSLDLPGGPGVVGLVAHSRSCRRPLALTSWDDLAAAVQRIRRLLDLDADPSRRRRGARLATR